MREASRRQCRRPAQAEPLATISSTTIEISELRDALRRRDPHRLSGNVRASVALILRPVRADIELLVIRRATRDGDPWSGHMGLPGGHRHEEDRDDCDTALRETLEELGVDLASNAELIGSLDDIQASAHGQPLDLVISCFVFLVGASPSLVPNDEVAETLWVSLKSLRSGELLQTHDVDFQGQIRHMPCWRVDGRVIWGLTYRIVSNLLQVCKHAGSLVPARP